jgi:KDO2-lipid IV(A) lauroyltransferase
VAAGRLLGWCLYALRWRLSVTRENVELTAPYLGLTGEQALRSLVRRAYEHVGLVTVSLLGLPHLLSRVPELTPPELPRRLLEQIEDGPVIFCSAHLGLWELVPHAITHALSPAVRARSLIVYQPLHCAAANRLVLTRRERCGIELLPARRSWPRLVAALKGGGIVGIVGDQRPHVERAPRQLLGVETQFDDGIGRLHALSGAPVWFVAIVRDGPGWQPYWEELSETPPGTAACEAHATVDRIVDRYAQTLSRCVARWPEQYLWAHRRWRPPKRTASEG